MNTPPRVYAWKVKCVHRGTGSVFDRSLILDTTETPVPAADLAEIDGLANERGNQFGLVRYRDYFLETPEAEIGRKLESADTFNIIWVDHYYEDEAGKPVSKHEFFDLVAGQEGTVLAGEPDSVIRIGPTDMANPQDWTVEKANDIAHFLEVIRFLAHSEWVRTPVQYGYRMTADGKKVSQFKCPSVYVMNSVLVFLRQLFADDDLFGRAVDIYAAHCSHVVKRAWVLERKSAFDQTLNDGPFPPIVAGLSSRDLIGLFLYGFGLIHWGDKNRDRRKQQQFRDLIQQYDRERVVFAFQSVLGFLASYSTHIAFPIAQDMEHWVQRQGHVGPDRVSLRQLLG